jgi:hypothetical protein
VRRAALIRITDAIDFDVQAERDDQGDDDDDGSAGVSAGSWPGSLRCMDSTW